MKLKYDEPLSSVAFNLDVRRYTQAWIEPPLPPPKIIEPTEGAEGAESAEGVKVGRCRLTLSHPR